MSKQTKLGSVYDRNWINVEFIVDVEIFRKAVNDLESKFDVGTQSHISYSDFKNQVEKEDKLFQLHGKYFILFIKPLRDMFVEYRGNNDFPQKEMVLNGYINYLNEEISKSEKAI